MDINFKSNKDKLKSENQQHDLHQLDEIKLQIANISRRYSQMEVNFKKQDDLLDLRNNDWDSDIKSSDLELEGLKNDIESMKEILSKNIKVMEMIISRFKDAAKLSDYNSTLEYLDKWKVENMITKDKFKKLLLKELELRIL